MIFNTIEIAMKLKQRKRKRPLKIQQNSLKGRRKKDHRTLKRKSTKIRMVNARTTFNEYGRVKRELRRTLQQ